MAVRQLIGFDNNPQVMDLLRENYAERRELDKEMGIDSTVRFFQAVFAGPMAGQMSIQYEYESLAAMEEANNKRFANPRWVELNQGLADAGLEIGFHGIMMETTPE